MTLSKKTWTQSTLIFFGIGLIAGYWLAFPIGRFIASDWYPVSRGLGDTFLWQSKCAFAFGFAFVCASLSAVIWGGSASKLQYVFRALFFLGGVSCVGALAALFYQFRFKGFAEFAAGAGITDSAVSISRLPVPKIALISGFAVLAIATFARIIIRFSQTPTGIDTTKTPGHSDQ